MTNQEIQAQATEAPPQDSPPAGKLLNIRTRNYSCAAIWDSGMWWGYFSGRPISEVVAWEEF
jgi:hypothetical protein